MHNIVFGFLQCYIWFLQKYKNLSIFRNAFSLQDISQVYILINALLQRRNVFGTCNIIFPPSYPLLCSDFKPIPKYSWYFCYRAFYNIIYTNLCIKLSNRSMYLFWIWYLELDSSKYFLQPRANEAGGMYGRGVLVRKYQTDQEIKVGYDSIFEKNSVPS